MNAKPNSLLNALIIILLTGGIFYFMMPQDYDKQELPFSEFSTKRALEQVKIISQQPHYVGSKNHDEVANYLVNQLKELGLQPIIQEGFTLSDGGTLVNSKNILARIKGTSTELSVTNNSKALLLLSHYDSAPHSYSHGASDDASGIATILETVRSFLHNKKQHKNDLIILFTDAEELGLNGAALFVTQHKWAKEIGLALNFEARGSSGPSYMLMETNDGNAKMVDAFTQANVKYPVSNSLMYSIYKMLPNDTDLTIFRENGKIQGYNFAFIDSHFNYHTAHDTYENLAPKTLAHQGTYLTALLNYFSNANLSNLNSTQDKVYFNIPFRFLSYPFSWIIPMLIITIVLFVLFVFIGIGKRVLEVKEIGIGFIKLITTLLLSGGITFIIWKLLLDFYPEYNEMLHGFTYNGHDYIYAFISLTLAFCFFMYQNSGKKNPEMSHLIAPLFLWLLLNIGIATQLKGGAFFIIPVFFSLLMLGYYVITQKINAFIAILFSIPTLILIVPFITMFPVGLGLKILFGSAILTVLCFGLLLPVFGNFNKKKGWATLFLLLSIGLFIKASNNAGFTKQNPKPNSLLYVLNGDTNKAYWTTYDKKLDQWTKAYLGDNPKKATELNTNKMYSKYGSEFTFMNDAPLKNIAKPKIEFIKDSLGLHDHFYKIKIAPNRKVNRYDIYKNEKLTIQNLSANGVTLLDAKSKIAGKINNKVLSYYVTDSIPLTMEFSIPVKQRLELNMVESSFDLMTNPNFTVAKRKEAMMPKPFVLNDAIVIKQKVKPSVVDTVLVKTR